MASFTCTSELAQSFDPLDNTPKIDFSKLVDESQIRGLSVLISGGANGLGAMLVRRLAVAGAWVTFADISTDAGNALERELCEAKCHVKFIKTDVTNWDAQVNVFKAAITFSPKRSLDLVIPCAGLPGAPLPLSPTYSLEEDPPKPSILAIEVTLIGVYYSLLLALHYFRIPPTVESETAPKKHVLFIGSLAAYLELPPVADYSASKYGVRGLWRNVRRQLRESGVRTNLLAPTFMPSQMIVQVTSALQSKGVQLARLEDAVEGVVRLICDEEIDARAMAIGGFGNFDLRDDFEGLDGGEEVLEYFKAGAMGGGMHTLRDTLAGRIFN